MNLPEAFRPYLELVNQSLNDTVLPDLPATLRKPIIYFLNMPGKKIRPLMTLFASEIVGGSTVAALPAAAAVELFHDFTLIHDDIMDKDELRRGFQTLHVKYGDGTAILVGDALIGLAYRELLKSPLPARGKVTEIFTEALIKVCAGQALDKEFETQPDVTLDDYLDMIGKKTAWLFQVSCQLGSLCGGGGAEQVQRLAEFGYWIGLGFQIQDDLLDFVADEAKLGKQVGSDFRMHKKTYVALKYHEVLREKSSLQAKYPVNIAKFSSFPDFQKALYELGIVEQVKAEADSYIQQGLQALGEVKPLKNDNLLYQVTRFLESRQY